MSLTDGMLVGGRVSRLNIRSKISNLQTKFPYQIAHLCSSVRHFLHFWNLALTEKRHSVRRISSVSPKSVERIASLARGSSSFNHLRIDLLQLAKDRRAIVKRSVGNNVRCILHIICLSVVRVRIKWNISE